MKQTYKITGMKCSGCAETTQKLLSSVKGVTEVKVNLQNQSAEINMQQPISNSTFEKALDGTSYVISEG
jgi:copper chaperone CopZ